MSLDPALTLERSGRFRDAVQAYEAFLARSQNEPRPDRARALRRLAVLLHHRKSPQRAGQLAQQSYDEAVRLGDLALAGEALITLGDFECHAGAMDAARWNYHNAERLCPAGDPATGRIALGLGQVDAIQGDLEAAAQHFAAAGAALASSDPAWIEVCLRHGHLAVRQGELDQAARLLLEATAAAGRLGDAYLTARCSGGTAELFQACRRTADAAGQAESALRAFDAMEAAADQSAMQRILGLLARDRGLHDEAGSHFHQALALAIESGWVLGQADAVLELALLEHAACHAERCRALYSTAHDLYGSLGARVEVADLLTRAEALQPVIPED